MNGVNYVRFIVLSLVMIVVATGLGIGLYRLAWPAKDLSGLWIAAIAAFVVGTAGWMTAGRGLAKDPKKFPVYFGAGLGVKLFLVGVAIVIVKLTWKADLTDFLVPFAVLFTVLGIGQMIVVARQAIALAEKSGFDRQAGT